MTYASTAFAFAFHISEKQSTQVPSAKVKFENLFGLIWSLTAASFWIILDFFKLWTSLRSVDSLQWCIDGDTHCLWIDHGKEFKAQVEHR